MTTLPNLDRKPELFLIHPAYIAEASRVAYVRNIGQGVWRVEQIFPDFETALAANLDMWESYLVPQYIAGELNANLEMPPAVAYTKDGGFMKVPCDVSALQAGRRILNLCTTQAHATDMRQDNAGILTMSDPIAKLFQACEVGIKSLLDTLRYIDEQEIAAKDY